MTKLQSPLKSGDDVIVITGKDKGRRGKITKVFTKTARVVVEGVNMVTKHKKPSMNNEGGKVSQEAPIHVSNVMLADPVTGNPTRVGYKIENGKKVRVAKKSGTVLEN